MKKSVSITGAGLSTVNQERYRLWVLWTLHTADTRQLLLLSWWTLFTASLTFCLKVFGFHQLKKSRQGQGRQMTPMASRYYQGHVIETNEPCYTISWYWILLLTDPELDRAETRSTQPFYRWPVSWGPKEELPFKEPAPLGSFCLYLDHFCFAIMQAHFYVQVHTCTRTHYLAFKYSLAPSYQVQK